MAVLSLMQGEDHKILRTESTEVKKVDRKIKKLVADMIETMFDANGIGIAACQVGVNMRIFIARLNVDTKQELVIPMVNPEILYINEEKTHSMEEGCLSLPKRFGKVTRPDELAVQFTDLNGRKRVLELEGLNAKIIQHEMDHLNAKLFIDRMEGEELTEEDLDELHKKRAEEG
jgi:peptide deformylase